ncbi:c-type cytochrome [Actibacterium sp. 188UL27-1]|uniref:c-type cytochrome n=1 Tax=Actibacterium sp. 188UL27-1 TaxID=2786961 RepID=UPI00195DD3B1|nr:c-type cytochrome [Actibacterium sp. 188UL27-1]MBM7068918.1 c-type cytochrome [Actibacterium sp. 188UL27-1]
MLAGSVAHAELVGDAEAGRKLAGQCRTCHGADGYAQIPVAPHIGGEPVAYLAAQLTAFREGTRQHEMMSVVAKSLTDMQIADLAAWYGGVTAISDLPDGISADAAPSACITCHGADGLSLMQDAPNLAGENVIYIETQLKAFRTGKRRHAAMTDIAKSLTEAEMRAAAEWYAATQLTLTR